MSLLLEALKRAEDDARKRRVYADSVAAPLDGIGDDDSPLVVQAGRLISRDRSRPGPLNTESADLPELAVPLEGKSLPDLYFPELSLVDDEQGLELEPSDKVLFAAPPLSEVQAEAVAKESPRDAPSPSPAPPSAKAPAPASAMPSPTPRQAEAAINAMLAKPGKSTPSAAVNRRTAILAGLAVLLLVPLALLFLWGDSLMGTAPVVANSSVVTPSSQAITVATVTAPTTDTVSTTVAAIGADGASAVPAVPAAPTVPEPGPTVQPSVEKPPQPQRQRASGTPSALSSSAPRATAAARTGPASASPSTPASVAVVLTPGVARLDNLLSSAYTSFQAGRTDDAEAAYRSILKTDPTQRDAWLGVAVIAHAAKRATEAADAYRQVLRLDPQNGTALTGLSNLDQSAHAPAQESRLRELLAATPQSAELNHALGLLMAGEARWSEAQALFFRAHSLSPTEPQFAFNLAVALDRLRKPDLARRYYGEALELAEGRRANFNVPATRARLAALTDSASAGAIKSP